MAAALTTAGPVTHAASGGRGNDDPLTRLGPKRKLRPGDVRVSASQVERRVKATVAWYQQAFVAAYDQSARKNSRWDDAARSALATAARAWALDPTRSSDADDQAGQVLRRAMALGCDDPLVTFVAAQFSRGEVSAVEAARRTIAAAARLERTRYSPYLRGSAFLTAAAALARVSHEISRAEARLVMADGRALVDQAVAQLPAVAADRTLPSHLLVRYVAEIWRLDAGYPPRERDSIFDLTYPLVSAAHGIEASVLPLLRAVFYAETAWELRGRGPARDVKPEAWPLFFERLERAEAEAARAVALKSDDPHVVAVMSRVAAGLYQDRDEIDAWLQVARRLEPGDRRQLALRANALQLQ